MSLKTTKVNELRNISQQKKKSCKSSKKKPQQITERLNYLDNIFRQLKIFKLDCKKLDRTTQFLYKEQRQKSILDFILSAGWKEKDMTSTPTMVKSKGTFS